MNIPRLKVSHRLGIAIILPLVGLLTFAVLHVQRSYSEFQDYVGMERLLDRVSDINEITYLLQHERSKGFLFSNGEMSESDLKSAFEETDAALLKMNVVANDISTIGTESSIAALAAFQESLAKLPETRAKTLSGEISPSGLIFAYSETVDAALNIQRMAGRATQSAEIARKVFALNSISTAKERASNEQAVIDGAISAGKLTKLGFETYSQYIVEQDLMIEAFLFQQDEEARASYEEILKSRNVLDIKKLRGRTGRLGGGGDIPAKKYAKWHEIAATRIAELRGIETTALGAINTAAADLSASALRSLSIWGILSLTISIATLVQAVVLARSITRPLAGLTNSLRALASGDLTTDVEGRDRSDELGVMAGAVEQLKEAALEKVELEKTAAENRHLTEAERQSREAEREREAAILQHTVDALGEALGRLAQGDVSHEIETPFEARFERLRTDFNTAQQHLRSVLASVEISASSIRENTQEMSQSAEELSRRTEQQAASLEEVAAALEEMTATVQGAADGAAEANSLAQNAFNTTKRSTGVVGDAISAMSKIQQSSEKISNIISVMDEIAFQTNLLALNAGVEAARAGDAGKGFAVVAQEVRELASRSAKAAKEISQLIATSNGEVDTGVKLVENTGTALSEIEGFMQEISTRIETIANSAKEQSAGLSEINSSVGLMDQATQQNAAMVEETTAATFALSQEVEALKQGLSSFRLHSGETRGSADVAA